MWAGYASTVEVFQKGRFIHQTAFRISRVGLPLPEPPAGHSRFNRMTKDELKTALRHQANEEFPAAAKSGGYPIRFNHCFLRVVYDNLFGAKWQTVLTNGKPAIHQLTEEQLERALEIGRRITDDPEVCRELNGKSLEWRNKT